MYLKNITATLRFSIENNIISVAVLENTAMKKLRIRRLARWWLWWNPTNSDFTHRCAKNAFDIVLQSMSRWTQPQPLAPGGGGVHFVDQEMWRNIAANKSRKFNLLHRNLKLTSFFSMWWESFYYICKYVRGISFFQKSENSFYRIYWFFFFF